MADLKRHEELVVITKTYDLILWSCNHTGKFPRNHRFVLGERLDAVHVSGNLGEGGRSLLTSPQASQVASTIRLLPTRND